METQRKLFSGKDMGVDDKDMVSVQRERLSRNYQKKKKPIFTVFQK